MLFGFLSFAALLLRWGWVGRARLSLPCRLFICSGEGKLLVRECDSLAAVSNGREGVRGTERSEHSLSGRCRRTSRQRSEANKKKGERKRRATKSAAKPTKTRMRCNANKGKGKGRRTSRGKRIARMIEFGRGKGKGKD